MRDIINLIEAASSQEDDTHYFVHGGRDFDEIDPKHYGSGEPGGIRPLGKGLYGSVAQGHKGLETAIEHAKIYGKKYGTHIHAFKLDIDDPTSKNIGYGGDKWARGGLGSLVKGSKRNSFGKDEAQQVEYEVLPWKHKEQHGIEAAVHDPSILKRIGKWDTRTPTEDIVNHIKKSEIG